MEDMELVFNLKVGQLREALAYADPEDLVGDILEDIDFGLYIENGYLNGVQVCDDDEEDEDDDYYDDDDDDCYYEGDDYDNDDEYWEDEEEEPYAAQPLPVRMQEDLAERIAKDVARGAYNFKTVRQLYGDQPQLLDRIDYLVNVKGIF